MVTDDPELLRRWVARVARAAELSALLAYRQQSAIELADQPELKQDLRVLIEALFDAVTADAAKDLRVQDILREREHDPEAKP